MRNLIFLFIAGMILVMNAQANEEELVGAMLFVVAPANEDPEGYEAAISVCSCALEKAKNEWESEVFKGFAEELMSYAKVVESAVSSPEALMANGIPGKSEGFTGHLKKLAPYIIECEEKFDTQVEF